MESKCIAHGKSENYFNETYSKYIFIFNTLQQIGTQMTSFFDKFIPS